MLQDNFWTSDGETFWSGCEDPPCAHQSNPGTNCELNAIVATMSTGPVGPSDGEGQTNTTRIMQTCAANGRLLQPNKPMTTIDAVMRASIPGEREVACKARARGYCPGLPGPMIMSTWSAPEFSYVPAVYHVV